MAGEFEAVLFDFGGVFTDSPFEAVEQVGRELGAGSGELSEIVFGPYHEDTDHPWHRLERGEISLRDARLVLLTANGGECGRGGGSLGPVEEIFESVVDSSAVGVRKPDPKIYRIALRELGDPAPERCVFLDDCQSNLDAATRLGIRSLLVDADPAAALAELERLLG